MGSMTPVYRVLPRFREILELTAPQYLTIRQLSDGRFILCAPHASADSEYVLTTERSPDEPRVYANLDRAIQFAHSLSGLIRFHVELFENGNDADLVA
jgi:hypothetical protein